MAGNSGNGTMIKEFQNIRTVSRILNVKKEFILNLIEIELVVPADPVNLSFDEEDIARIRMIQDLTERFNLTDDSLQIILHLLDQIHYLQGEIKKIHPDS